MLESNKQWVKIINKTNYYVHVVSLGNIRPVSLLYFRTLDGLRLEANNNHAHQYFETPRS